MTRPTDPYDWVETWAWPIIERGALPGCSELVLLRLAAHANRDGEARPSTRTIAKQIGRSDRAARLGFEALRRAGYIDGQPLPKVVTRWRLVADPDEQRELRNRATRSAEHGSADDHPRSAEHGFAEDPVGAANHASADSGPSEDVICDLSANHLRTRTSREGEGEGTSTSTPSAPTGARDVGRGRESLQNSIPILALRRTP
jgi:hypothetical protein